MKPPTFCLLYLFAAELVAQDATVLQTHQVTMRDGIRLATDVYGSTPNVQRPTLLMRTPYDKGRAKANAERFVTAGYVAVVQDTRGAHASEGKYVHYNNDDQDGFDTIQWIVQQSWSNRKVGMWGSSHPGAVQWVAAADRAPGLIAIAPTAAPSSLYHTLYQGGALRLGLTAGAGAVINPPPPGIAMPEDFTQFHYHLPLTTLDQAIGWPMPWLKGVVAHNRLDGFWRRLEVTPELPKLDVAAQNIGGYYDLFCGETVENFLRLPKRKKQLILGPWDHATIGKQAVAGVDFGSEATLDIVGENLRWFDRFLKPAKNSSSFPPVRYFLMGDNVWRTAEDWPPPEAVSVAFYLHSGGKSNTRSGDGRLTRLAPVAAEPPDHFESDPDKPTPSESLDAPLPSRSTPWRPTDRSTIEDRQDVLVYTAEVQDRPLSIAGRVLADLWISAYAPDADWAVKLIDVAANGTTRGIAEGILRSSARDPLKYPALLTPGGHYRITVDLGHTGATILARHTLRVEVAGSAFPMFDRNLHTGEGPSGTRKQVCRQTVYHGPGTASRLLLPLLPKGGGGESTQRRSH
jgi:uncharacterized protein